MIRKLVALQVDLNVIENEFGYTPLMLAIVLSNEWAAMELIRAGADFKIAARNGRTSTFVAAERGLTELLRLMLRSGQIHIDDPVAFPNCMRLLHVGAFHKQPHVVSLLIDMGANLNALDDDGGYTPLMMSLLGRNFMSALELIDKGADLNVRSISGRNAMYAPL
jgi:ankyrin repeat protein